MNSEIIIQMVVMKGKIKEGTVLFSQIKFKFNSRIHRKGIPFIVPCWLTVCSFPLF